MSRNSQDATRRALLLGSGAALLASPFTLTLARAGNHEPTAVEACSAIDAMIITAAERKAEAGAWAITVAPQAVRRMEEAVVETKRLYDNASVLSDRANVNLLFSQLNVLISFGFFVLGGSIATAPLIVASVTTAGVFLVADAVTSVQNPEALTIAGDVGVNRIGNTLTAAGDEAYALSKGSAVYANGAGKILSGVAVVMAAYSARQKSQTATALATEEQELRSKLDDYVAEARKLNDVAYAQSVREACMRALEEDMSSARGLQNPQCLY